MFFCGGSGCSNNQRLNSFEEARLLPRRVAACCAGRAGSLLSTPPARYCCSPTVAPPAAPPGRCAGAGPARCAGCLEAAYEGAAVLRLNPGLGLSRIEIFGLLILV